MRGSAQNQYTGIHLLRTVLGAWLESFNYQLDIPTLKDHDTLQNIFFLYFLKMTCS